MSEIANLTAIEIQLREKFAQAEAKYQDAAIKWNEVRERLATLRREEEFQTRLQTELAKRDAERSSAK